MDSKVKTFFLPIPKHQTTDIIFEDITYTVPLGYKNKKKVLRGVSGKFESGQLTAIMGPSGSGKTSLLNILTGFSTTGTSGTIKSINNCQMRIGSQQYKKYSSYILQDDHLVPLFTVGEIMSIAADLKLDGCTSYEMIQLIDDILDSFGLSTVRDTLCGSLSGGEKKRLSIVLELIGNPSIMFLDEPTTGLDSSASVQCINMLKELARSGRTIICSIHQPSATLYEMFDQVYVLAEGKCIYRESSQNTVTYLSSLGFDCPHYHNPADFLLEVANGEHGDVTDLLGMTVVKSQSMGATQVKSDHKLNETVSQQSEWRRFGILLKRSLLQLYRDWTICHLKILIHFLIGIIMGLNYYNFGNDGSKALPNIGYFIISCVYLTFTSMMPAVLKFPSELAVLKKENFNNWYKLKTYYLAVLILDIPVQIISTATYTFPSYFLSSQPPEPFRFFMVLLVMILVSLGASSIGLLLGTMTNPVNGTFFGSVLIGIMLTLGGTLLLFPHMNKIMYLLTYGSFLAYSVEGILRAVYGFNRAWFPCPEEAEYCHMRVPNMVLKELGLTKNNYWADVAFLFGNFLVLRMVAYYTLKRRLRIK